MKELEFIELGFENLIDTRNRKSVADIFNVNNSCGIYILYFDNEEYYVGQTINFVKRFTQHRAKYRDIIYVSFKEIGLENLTEVERTTVHEFELLKKKLRNINIVSIINGKTDLDLIVSVEDQTKWLNYELPLETLNTPRSEYPELRKKYTDSYNKLKKHPLFDAICQIVQGYVLNTIPYPRATEYYFWSCSCLPSNNNADILGDKLLLRLNIFWQETLNIANNEFYYLDDNDIEQVEKVLLITIFLSKSKLFEHYTTESLKAKYPSLEFGDHHYSSGGQDQQQIFIYDFEFIDFLFDTPITDAIKEFNLRLMRKRRVQQ